MVVTPDDGLTLLARINGLIITSDRLAYLGRDWQHISGPRAIWKLSSSHAFTTFINKCEQTSQPPKIFPGDGGLNDNAFDGPLPAETLRLIAQARAMEVA